jgi:C-terminal processing protease CtpA/Prc
MKSLIVITLLLLTNNIFAYYPLIVKSSRYVPDSVLFDLRNEKIGFRNNYLFMTNKKTFVGGINANKKKNFELLWEKEFDHPIIYKPTLTYIEYNLFIENIEKISLNIQTGSGRWYSYKLNVKNEGYQPPIQIDFSYFKIPKSENSVKSIKIIGELKNKNSQIVIGNVKISTLRLQTEQFIHPLFGYTLADMVDNCKENSFINIPVQPIILSHSGIYNQPYYPLNLIDTSLVDITRLFENALQLYPFYKERKINKDSVLFEYNCLKDTLKNMKSLISGYGDLIKKFNDVHFNISQSSSSSSPPKYSPVKFARINNEILVASVFDSTLNLCLGDRVVSKNDISIEELISSVSNNFIGNKKTRESYAITSISYGIENENVTLCIIRNSDTLKIDYTIKNNYTIPSNYIPKNGEFKIFEKKIGYLKINSFDDEIWYKYISLKLSNINALIFDVRGNKGGSSDIVSQILSTLIKENIILYNAFIPPFDNIETICIEPNKLFSFQIPKIVILIDEHTTCAAELFSFLLKKHCNAIIIGNSCSAGALAMRVPIKLPGNNILSVNSIIKPIIEENYFVEEEGLSPDIWVWRSKIEDLYPYKDKILQTAIRFLCGK